MRKLTGFLILLLLVVIGLGIWQPELVEWALLRLGVAFAPILSIINWAVNTAIAILVAYVVIRYVLPHVPGWIKKFREQQH